MSMDNSIRYISFETDEPIRHIIESGPHQLEQKRKYDRWRIYTPDSCVRSWYRFQALRFAACPPRKGNNRWPMTTDKSP